jgi:hypothetical protein
MAGVGSMPTGSAVVTTSSRSAKSVERRRRRVPRPRFSKISGGRSVSSLWKKSVRCTISDSWWWIDRVLAQIAESSAAAGSASSMLQQGRREQTVPVVIKTHMAGAGCAKAMREINRQAFISEPAMLIRVEGKDE